MHTTSRYERDIPPGMLSAPQIDFLANELQIIKHYDAKYLKPACYDMRLGSPAYRWQGEKELIFELDSDSAATLIDIQNLINKLNDPIYQDVPTTIKASILILPPNSITFVTTYEKFNLPGDIIARFNLKVKFVHMGLLLGTGPIVDPGFQSRILIPLHNFSNRPVRLEYGKPLISVEFTKTLNPNIHTISNKDVITRKNDKGKLQIADFLKNTTRVESSVYDALSRTQELVKESDELISKIRNFGFLAGIGVAISLAMLFLSVFSMITKMPYIINTIEPTISKMQDEINVLKKKFAELPNSNNQTINKKD